MLMNDNDDAKAYSVGKESVDTGKKPRIRIKAAQELYDNEKSWLVLSQTDLF